MKKIFKLLLSLIFITNMICVPAFAAVKDEANLCSFESTTKVITYQGENVKPTNYTSSYVYLTYKFRVTCTVVYNVNTGYITSYSDPTVAVDYGIANTGQSYTCHFSPSSAYAELSSDKSKVKFYWVIPIYVEVSGATFEYGTVSDNLTLTSS